MTIRVITAKCTIRALGCHCRQLKTLTHSFPVPESGSESRALHLMVSGVLAKQNDLT